LSKASKGFVNHCCKVEIVDDIYDVHLIQIPSLVAVVLLDKPQHRNWNAESLIANAA